jgi:hypothetical protein
MTHFAFVNKGKGQILCVIILILTLIDKCKMCHFECHRLNYCIVWYKEMAQLMSLPLIFASEISLKMELMLQVSICSSSPQGFTESYSQSEGRWIG